MYIRYEWRELTEDGRLVRIEPVEMYAGEPPDETLTGSFDSEDEAMFAARQLSEEWHKNRFPENLVLVKKVDL